jgi:hypothetical protein
MRLRGLRQPDIDRAKAEQPEAEQQRRSERQHAALRSTEPLEIDGVAGLADPDEGLADADRHVAVDDNARQPAPLAVVAVEIHAVGAADILGHELTGLVVKHPDMPCRHIGIVDDDVVVIAAADAELAGVDPDARRDVPVAIEDFDPDHRTTCTPSRKRLPSLIASS